MCYDGESGVGVPVIVHIDECYMTVEFAFPGQFWWLRILECVNHEAVVTAGDAFPGFPAPACSAFTLLYHRAVCKRGQQVIVLCSTWARTVDVSPERAWLERSLRRVSGHPIVSCDDKQLLGWQLPVDVV